MGKVILICSLLCIKNVLTHKTEPVKMLLVSDKDMEKNITSDGPYEDANIWELPMNIINKLDPYR